MKFSPAYIRKPVTVTGVLVSTHIAWSKSFHFTKKLPKLAWLPVVALQGIYLPVEAEREIARLGT